MDKTRRLLLQGLASAGGLTLLTGTGLLVPSAVLGEIASDPFNTKSVEQALKVMRENTQVIETVETDKISIKAPELAENGAVVPVTVSVDMDNVTSIAIFVEDNPQPLTSVYTIPEGTEPYVSTRVKMGKSSRLIAVVESGDELYSANKKIKVTIGGCGG